MTPTVMAFLAKAGPQGSVLEIGSYNVNGTARDAIRHASWLGVDMREGPGVDLVADASALPLEYGAYDCVVIAECLEHCEDWRAVLSEGWRCLRIGGTLAVTTPAPGFPRHDYPSDYWRFTAGDWWNIFRAHSVHEIDQWKVEGIPGSGIILTKISDAPLRLDAIHPEPVPPPGKVVFATARYEGKVWGTHEDCLLRDTKMLSERGIPWSYQVVDGDAYIGRAKNTLCARFLEDPEAAALIIIDWDHWWDDQAILRLLSHPEDVVGADYPMKNRPGRFCAKLVPDPDDPSVPLGRFAEGLGHLLLAEAIPGGFVRFRKRALERFRDAYPQKVYHDPSADEGHPNQDRAYTAFFEHNYITGGEDHTFCHAWRAIGGQLWIDPAITMGHWWPQMHAGNLDLSLREGRQKLTDEATIAAIRGEAA